MPRASAGAPDIAFVRLAHVDPPLDGAGHILLPQIGLLGDGKAAAEHERLIGMQHERQHPHHHAFVGFGGVARDSKRVVPVVIAIHVSDLEVDFEYDRARSHRYGFSVV